MFLSKFKEPADRLSAELQTGLPSIKQIERELGALSADVPTPET